MEELKPTSFKLLPYESKGLKTLSELTGETQTDIVRRLIRAEMEKQKEALEVYQKTLEEARKRVKK